MTVWCASFKVLVEIMDVHSVGVNNLCACRCRLFQIGSMPAMQLVQGGSSSCVIIFMYFSVHMCVLLQECMLAVADVSTFFKLQRTALSVLCHTVVTAVVSSLPIVAVSSCYYYCTSVGKSYQFWCFLTDPVSA